MKVRVFHVERGKNACVGKLVESDMGRAFDDHGKQRIARVGIRKLFAWLEIQLALARDDLKHVLIPKRRVGTPPSSGQQRHVLRQPTCMMNQATDRYRLAVRRLLMQVLVDVILEAVLALLLMPCD